MIIFYIAGPIILLMLLLLIPIKGRRYKPPTPDQHADERDVMFSRNEIKPGSERFNEYYTRRPENLERDNQFRSKPGLLSSKSTFYDRYSFASSGASFEAVSAFFGMRDGVPSDIKHSDDPHKLIRFLKAWGKKLGAIDVGITEMKPYHFYTVGGRGEGYGKDIKNDHRYGIAFIVEMDLELTQTAPQGGIVMESAHQYLNSGMIATQVALTLRNLGYSARTHIDANYDLICPLVAKDAGLGEIGRMGLLMTPGLGPRVRIAVVTTDAPLIADKPTHSDSVLDFCTRCKKCAVVCPSASISHNDEREEHKGGLRWKIDQEACFNYWCQAGTDCGRCMAVCPYSHKNNALHNFVRWGISNNVFFRRIALHLDDLFYGKKPRIRDNPDWIDQT